jgi:hypothetical protein
MHAVISVEDATVNAFDCVISGCNLVVKGSRNVIICKNSPLVLHGSSNQAYSTRKTTIHGVNHDVICGSDVTIHGSNHSVVADHVSAVHGSNHDVCARRVDSVHGSNHVIHSPLTPSCIVGHNVMPHKIDCADYERRLSVKHTAFNQRLAERRKELSKETPIELESPASANMVGGSVMIEGLGNTFFINGVRWNTEANGSTGITITDDDESSSPSSSSSDEDVRKAKQESKTEYKKKKSDERSAADRSPAEPNAKQAKRDKIPREWKQDPIKLKHGEDGCAICFEYKCDAAVQECGHLCMCMACARKIAEPADAKCPICKQTIAYIQGMRLVS